MSVLLATQVFCPSVFASILIRSPGTPEARLQVLLQKKRSGNLSFIEHWRSKTPAAEKVHDLQTAFEEAQRKLLSQGPEASKDLFQRVVAFAHTADWKVSERRLIFQSFLRLALAEKNVEIKNDYVTRAITLDESMEPDSEIFAPEFIKGFRSDRAALLKKSQSWRPNFPSDVEIYINGRRLSNTRKIELVPGTKRVTLVSNWTIPHTLLVNTSALSRTPIKLQPLIEGKCGSLNWNYSAPDRKDFVAVLDTCFETADGPTNDALEASPRTAPLRTAVNFPTVSPSESILKKPLFWS